MKALHRKLPCKFELDEINAVSGSSCQNTNMNRATTALLLIVLTIGACQPTDPQEQSIEETKELAEQGDPDAQYQLARAYWNGEGILKNDKQATHWHKKAAEQGHPEAQYSLGFAYRYGIGVHEDLKQTIYWWKQAAEQGHDGTQFALGILYYHEQDWIQAYAWLLINQANKAEELRESNIYYINKIKRKLTTAQINQAQERVAQLHEKIQARKTISTPAN